MKDILGFNDDEEVDEIYKQPSNLLIKQCQGYLGHKNGRSSKDCSRKPLFAQEKETVCSGTINIMKGHNFHGKPMFSFFLFSVSVLVCLIVNTLFLCCLTLITWLKNG